MGKIQKKDIENYSTMSETKAAFGKRGIHSLNYIINRYIEDYVKKKFPNCNNLLPNCNSFLNYNKKPIKNNHQIRLNSPLKLIAIGLNANRWQN